MDEIKTSKILSYALRHAPQDLALDMDGEGWVEVQQLLDRLLEYKNISLDLQGLKKLVAKNSKQRFALSPDCRKIRANQGHSIAVDLKLAPAVPPATLYHGTATRFLPAILAEGLNPGSRLQVHLSGQVQTALEVGRRHGSPVVLKVDTQAMLKQGFVFYLSENNVWLVDSVPPEFLQAD